jgi:hypothetical protein
MSPSMAQNEWRQKGKLRRRELRLLEVLLDTFIYVELFDR